MVPFLVLAVLFVLFSGLGMIGVASFGWWTSLRFALAGMFLLTASAHWGKRRPDLIRMVPPVFPRPDRIVTATGILEILGAVGLTLPATAPDAGAGLCLLLLAMFPANVHAAQQGLSIAGRPVPGLIPRTLLQVVFVAATAAVFLARP